MAVVLIKSLCYRMWFAVWLWIRPVLKGLLRRTTQLCELQRICYGTLPGAERATGVEFSLEHSRHPDIIKCCQYLDSKSAEQELRPDVTYYAVYAVVRVKNISTKLHPRFSGQLLSCIGSIWGYRQLKSEVEAIRSIKCINMPSPAASPDPAADALASGQQNVTEKLQQLWTLLKPDAQLTGHKSKQWQEIGFQGTDPSTDFRGMGLLGLENLLYFAQNHQSAARHVLSRSSHPRYGYSFAIVGINLSHLLYSLLESGALKHHFYNIAVKELQQKPGVSSTSSTSAGLLLPSLCHFHQLYCTLFIDFDALWRNEKPKDIMEFSRIRELFEAQIRARLLPYNAILKSSFVLENV